ncbi:unnamed protein product [Cercospora beticola]|nr:unnamed protein product [Cercospora beticola]
MKLPQPNVIQLALALVKPQQKYHNRRTTAFSTLLDTFTTQLFASHRDVHGNKTPAMTRQILERRRTIPDLRNSPPLPKQHGFEKMDSTNTACKRNGSHSQTLDSSKNSSATLKLHELPEELLQDMLEYLDRAALKHLSLTSKWCYDKAVPYLWREVDLVDCKGPDRFSGYRDVVEQPRHDDHDDTPLIKKLFLLATKPKLAEHVQVLTHRCHMPPPAIFHELPKMSFSGMTLSSDPRTIALCKMAVANMTKVHTLRIILGHANLVDALLRCFFDEDRAKKEGVVSVRRLWLENCRISAGLNLQMDPRVGNPFELPTRLTFEGLESVRLRRLPFRPVSSAELSVAKHLVYARHSSTRPLQDGVGGRFEASTSTVVSELRAGQEYHRRMEELAVLEEAVPGSILEDELQVDDKCPLAQMFESAHKYDEQEYEALEASIELPEQIRNLGKLTRRERAVMAYRGVALDVSLDAEMALSMPQPLLNMQRETVTSADTAMLMLKNASDTLTSINLDWIMGSDHRTAYMGGSGRAYQQWVGMFRIFFELRFPNLRSLQLRNCVVAGTTIPWDILLLDSSPEFSEQRPTNGQAAVQDGSSPTFAPLAFMEAHPEIRCLAWPMSNFFSDKPSTSIRRRVDVVMDNLARNLVDLRVDTKYSEHGEPYTDDDDLEYSIYRERRRRFISEFVPKLRRLESIKIEGGMPRDERREILRALHACPLQKIVTIGICSPLGNTWGRDGADVIGLVDQHDRANMEAEDKSTVNALGGSRLHSPDPDTFTFQPIYRWDGQPPMLHTIASYHARTVRELKFCGWKGAPLLLNPPPITTPLLSSLRHFHKLENIHISIWLPTHFEGAPRDSEIISYWTDTRSPESTALTLVAAEELEAGWEKELRTEYAPNALAWRVTNMLGKFLSEEVKMRKGGVKVRASFSVGDWGGIFDLDVRVGKGSLGSDICLGFEGPREELEEKRRREKLDNRRWF